MADQKISDLTLGTPASGDYIPYVDVTNSVTKKAYKSDLKGDTGTMTVGSVTTGAAGSSAIITNVGTSSAAILNFTIPRGDTGATGATGSTGNTGPAGADGLIATIGITTANGVSGSSSGGANPRLTVTLGAITPTTVNGLTITATTGSFTLTNLKTLTVSDSTTLANASILLGNGKTLTLSDSTTLATSAITFGNGKILTVSNTLTLAGTDSTVMTFPSTSATIARTDAANTFTGVQTITNLTLPDQGQIKMTVPTTDLKATGPTCGDFNCGYSSSAIGDLVYLDSSGTWQKTDANTLALYNGLLAIALEVKASGNALLVALPGSFIYSTTGFPTWTIGSPIYMSETAGAMTHTQPTTTDAAIRVVGWGIHADKMYFFPSPDYITHT